MDEQLHERVREIVAAIPPGSVASYGDVAELAGAPSPRLVGRVLAEDGSDLPWHRVLRADGTPAHHLAQRQLELLRAEGVLADGRRVSMRRYRWDAVEVLDEPNLFE
jgi:methylated-DNA-protein-cysteine methyltransferase-like protein